MTEQEIEAGLAILRAEAEKNGVRAAAAKIGKSRPAVSMALAGSYPARLDAIAKAALAALWRRECPIDGGVDYLACVTCAAAVAAAMPTHSPAAAREWRARKNCKYNQKEQGQ